MEFENVKKVKFIGNPDNYANLEWGNIYDVIRYIPDDRVYYDSVCINVNGSEERHFLYDGNDVKVFKDASIEYRRNIISGILE